MYRLERVEDNGEVLLNAVSDSDYEFNLLLNDKCEVTNSKGRTIEGVVYGIDEDKLILFTAFGRITIPYDDIVEIEKIEYTKLKVSDFRYVLTDIGGGWGTIHCLYGVTPSGDVYKTENFHEKTMDIHTELNLEYVGHLDKVELGLQSRKCFGVMDASYLVVCEVGDALQVVYEGDNVSENNPCLYNNIQAFVRAAYDRKFTKAKANVQSNFVIGEVNSDEFRSTMNALVSGGVPIRTTFHANDIKDVIDKIEREINDR